MLKNMLKLLAKRENRQFRAKREIDGRKMRRVAEHFSNGRP